jgi:hypothetical protein
MTLDKSLKNPPHGSSEKFVKVCKATCFLMVKSWQILTLIMNQGFLPLRLKMGGLFWQKHLKARVCLAN